MKILMRLLVIMLLGALLAPTASVMAQEVGPATVTQQAAPAALCGISGEYLVGGLIDLLGGDVTLMETTITPKGAGGCKTPKYTLTYPKYLFNLTNAPHWEDASGTNLAECYVEREGSEFDVWVCPSIFITTPVVAYFTAEPSSKGTDVIQMLRDNIGFTKKVTVTDKIYYVDLPLIQQGIAVATSAAITNTVAMTATISFSTN